MVLRLQRTMRLMNSHETRMNTDPALQSRLSLSHFILPPCRLSFCLSLFDTPSPTSRNQGRAVIG